MAPKKKAAPDADPAFAPVAAAFAADRSVTVVRKFGSSSLRVNGKVFAMLMKGRLVVKLPGGRVDELASSGKGEPFKLGSKTMKEWASLPPGGVSWTALAREARDFVAKRH